MEFEIGSPTQDRSAPDAEPGAGVRSRPPPDGDGPPPPEPLAFEELTAETTGLDDPLRSWPFRGPDPVGSLPALPAGGAETPTTWVIDKQGRFKAESGGSRRRLWVALSTAVVTVAAAAFFLLGGRGDQAEAFPLALRFTAGERTTYRLVMTFDGTVADGATEAPVSIALDMTFVMRTESVDADGVATLVLRVKRSRVEAGGTVVPTPAQREVRMRVAPDGRVLETDGLTAAGGAGSAFPGMDQLTPLLPHGAVPVGTSWDSSYSMPFPVGDGAIDVDATSSLLSYGSDGGTDAAVVQTELHLAMDAEVTAAELLDLTDTPDPGLPEGLRVVYDGGADAVMLATVDASTGQLSLQTSRGTFDVTMRFEGVPNAGEARLTGSFDIRLTAMR